MTEQIERQVAVKETLHISLPTPEDVQLKRELRVEAAKRGMLLADFARKLLRRGIEQEKKDPS